MWPRWKGSGSTWTSWSTTPKRLVEPTEVAGLALWLAGPQASMATGATFTLDGGWTAK
jgi:NAD(P)-dependent dehydrogenase (short-subunit alcohol dehydrogenase family)